MSIINSVIKGKQPVIDTLNVTPSTSAQQITATGGTDGYSPVNVSAVTSSIDANIVAGNIKKDVQILGVTGSYEGTTPTGTLNIPANGVYDVTNYASADVQVPTTAPAYYIDKTKDANNVLQAGTTLMSFSGLSNVGNYGLAYAYYYNTNITGTVDLSWLVNASNTGSFSYAFAYSGITGVDLSNLETVSGNSALQSAFLGCTGLTGTINLSKLKRITASNNAMSLTFSGCTGITGVNLSSLEYISDSASQTFQNCSNLTSVDLSKLTYIYGSSTCANMFQNCNITGSLDLSSLIVVDSYSGCNSMFYNNANITSVDLSNLVSIANTSVLQGMFSGCTSLASVDISKLCKIGRNLRETFRNTSLTTLSFPSLAYTATNLNGAFQDMLKGVTGCTVHFPAEWQTTMSSWSAVTNGFGGTNTTVLFDLPNVTTVDLTNITEIKYSRMFYQFGYNNYFSNITKVDLKNLETISGDNSCYQMFSGCSGITSVDLSKLTTIDANGACNGMFADCTGLTTISLPMLNKISKMSACSSMFIRCSGLTSVDLSALTDVGGTEEGMMFSMFSGCTSLTSVDLSALEIVGGYNVFRYAFRNCTSLTSLSFPALKTVQGNGPFTQMLDGVKGCTVHFPSNLSGTTGLDATAIGGINTTVLFDLPSTGA